MLRKSVMQLETALMITWIYCRDRRIRVTRRTLRILSTRKDSKFSELFSAAK